MIETSAVVDEVFHSVEVHSGMVFCCFYIPQRSSLSLTCKVHRGYSYLQCCYVNHLYRLDRGERMTGTGRFVRTYGNDCSDLRKLLRNKTPIESEHGWLRMRREAVCVMPHRLTSESHNSTLFRFWMHLIPITMFKW